MLTKNQVQEIKDHLNTAQNPIFFFDNDPDGLCSFLLLQRYAGRGRGVAIKSFPSLDITYFRKVEELNADYIFILDKPMVSEEFFKKVEERNIPVVWIDHHEVDNVIPDFVNYYNPLFNEMKTNEPVTALCYQISNNKDDMWLAMIGCASDGFLPDFYEKFNENYLDISIKTKNAYDILYKSRFGEIIRLLSNGLKDKTSNVVGMLKFLIKVKSPYEVLEENSKNYYIHKVSKHIDKKYRALFDRAKQIYSSSDKILFFKYSGDLSISGELANQLIYTFPDKIVVVAYVKGIKVNISLRGKNVKDGFLSAINGIVGAVGGGHKDAVGGVILAESLPLFEKKLKEFFSDSKI